MVLLTGSSGFLGQVIKKYLADYSVKTIGRKNVDIVVDIAKDIPVLPACDIIIHAAGKAHSVPKTNLEKQQFFDVNTKGTANLLAALENQPLPKAFVFISSVSVYGVQSGKLINEACTLNASDAYGQSKIAAEKLVLNWCKINNVVCTILRLPLVAGSNAPGNLGNMINGIKKGYYFNINGGSAQKSIVLADDVAKIIIKAASIGGIYNLTDQYHPNFSELSQLIAKQLGKSSPLTIPLWLAKILAKIGDKIGPKSPINSDKLFKIISDLTFDDSKATEFLGWRPMPILENFKIGDLHVKISSSKNI